MAPENPVSSTLGSVAIAAVQITQIATVALGLLGIYRQARNQWIAAHPADPSPFMTDAQLIDGLDMSSGALVALADRLLAKYQAPADPAPII